jgi:predicted transglutaminase-like cysteine proteinase
MVFSRWRVTAPSVIAALCLGLSVACGPAAALEQAGAYGARAVPVLKPFTIPDLAPFQRPTEPFGVASTPVSGGGLIRKWHDVQTGLTKDYQTLGKCRQDPTSCAAAPARFLALVESARPLAGLARIAAVNSAVNQAVRPMTDLDQYGQVELWATPLMTFASGAGDCEDYAIAKYAALIELGISANDLRLLAVYDRNARENHAVAAVRFEQHWLILDNLVADVQDAATSTRLNPLFVLGDQWVRRVDAVPPAQPITAQQQAPASRVTLSDLPERLSIGLGLINPVL